MIVVFNISQVICNKITALYLIPNVQLYSEPLSFLVSIVLCSALLATQSLRSPSCLCGLLPPSVLDRPFIPYRTVFFHISRSEAFVWSSDETLYSAAGDLISTLAQRDTLREHGRDICIHAHCGSMCTFAFCISSEWEMDIAVWNRLMIIKHGYSKYGNLRVIWCHLWANLVGVIKSKQNVLPQNIQVLQSKCLVKNKIHAVIEMFGIIPTSC